MEKKPRDPKESFFAGGAAVYAVLGGLLIGSLTLFAFYWGIHEHGYSIRSSQIPEDVMIYARTMAFVVLAASQLFYAFSKRSSTKSIFQIGVFSNRFLVWAVIAGLVLQYISISVPFLAKAFGVRNLLLSDWVIVIGLALIPLAINEIIKVFIRMGGTEKA